MRFSTFLGIIFTAISLSIASQAAPSEAIKSMIQQQIAEAIGCGVDEERHANFQRFWTQQNVANGELENILDKLNLAQEWQYNFWDSAYETIQRRKIFRTPDYQSYFHKLNQNPVYADTLKRSEELLLKIAAGNPIPIPPAIREAVGKNLSHIILDENMSIFIRDNVGVGFDRLRSLLSREWPPEQKQFTYPKQNISYYSDVRLAMRPLVTPIDKLLQWEVQQSINCSSIFGLLVENYSEINDFKEINSRYIKNMQDSGMQLQQSSSSTWHGYPSEDADFVFVSEGHKNYLALKIVRDRGRRINYIFSVTSPENSFDAISSLSTILLRFSIVH